MMFRLTFVNSPSNARYDEIDSIAAELILVTEFPAPICQNYLIKLLLDEVQKAIDYHPKQLKLISIKGDMIELSVEI